MAWNLISDRRPEVAAEAAARRVVPEVTQNTGKLPPDQPPHVFADGGPSPPPAAAKRDRLAIRRLQLTPRVLFSDVAHAEQRGWSGVLVNHRSPPSRRPHSCRSHQPRVCRCLASARTGPAYLVPCLCLEPRLRRKSALLTVFPDLARPSRRAERLGRGAREGPEWSTLWPRASKAGRRTPRTATRRFARVPKTLASNRLDSTAWAVGRARAVSESVARIGRVRTLRVLP